jgi:hypothetical protein
MHVETDNKSQSPPYETSGFFIFTVLLLYITVEITGILFHPMWRDEIHPWTIAGASSSLVDLLHRKVYEGHPDLWFIMVYGVKCLCKDPVSMQLLHSGIAILTVFLILKYAPFTRVQRSLLVFGYFYLFEYAIISRNYAIGILLITLFLVLNRQKEKFILLMAFLLFLLAQTSIYGAILCIAFLLTNIFEFFVSRNFREALLKQKITLIISIILIGAGIGYSIHSVIPPPSGSFVPGITHVSLSELTLREFIKSIAAVWKAWIPIPLFQVHFWNTNFIRNENVQAIFALILIFSAGFLFIKRPVIFFFYLIGLAGIISFINLYYYGYLRHHGHLFILLIACLWLNTYHEEKQFSLRFAFAEKFYGLVNRNAKALFSILLIIHLLTGIFTCTIQFFIPFSTGKMTADYIREKKLDRFVMAGDQDVGVESFSGYLNKEVFFFSMKTFGSYIIFNNMRIQRDKSTVLSMADSLLKQNQDTILLVMNYPLKGDSTLNLLKINSFENSIVSDETHEIYLLTRGENKRDSSNKK